MSVTYIDDQTGNIAVFTYFSDMLSPVLQIAGENEIIYQKVQVNGLPADLYLDSEEGEANAIVWVDERNGAAFRIGGVISGEELVCMAESVEAVPRNVRFRPSWLPEGYDETSAQDYPAKGDNVPKGLDAGKSVLTYEDGKGGALTITYAQEFDVTGLRPNEVARRTGFPCWWEGTRRFGSRAGKGPIIWPGRTARAASSSGFPAPYRGGTDPGCGEFGKTRGAAAPGGVPAVLDALRVSGGRTLPAGKSRPCALLG